MAALKSSQILNFMQSWTAPHHCTERWCGAVRAAAGKVLSSSASTESLWTAKALMCQGAEGSRVHALYISWTNERLKNWEWKNEDEWKQDHNFGRPKNCKKEDTETCPKITKMWHVGTSKPLLVSPFYWTLFSSYKKAHDLQHYLYWGQYLNPRFK